MLRFWLPVHTLPHNGNGKLDRGALKSWEEEFLSCDAKSSYASLGSSSRNSWDRVGGDRFRRTLIDSWKLVFRVHGDEVDADTTFLHVGVTVFLLSDTSPD
jgi:hypothetical protein